MAQTGYTPILIYSSSTASNAPSAGNLTNSTLGSELAINITDGKLFYKDNANAVQVIAWKTTPTTAGGTGLISYAAGDMLYYATGTALSKLTIGAAGTWLGSSGTAPQWNAPAALTKTDDTNVTLTLGGSASTALLNAASLTLGWTGQLSVARGGTGAATFTAGRVLFGNGTSAINTNANFFWDNANNRLGVSTGSPATTLDVNGAGNFNGALTINGNFTVPSGVTVFNTSGDFYLRAGTSGNLYLGSNGANSKLNLFASAGVAINNTTDPGAGNLGLSAATANFVRLKTTTATASDCTVYFDVANNFSGNSQSFVQGIGPGNSGLSQLSFGVTLTAAATTATDVARFDTGGNFRPSADNTYSNGTGALRWSVIYSATPTINTSDGTTKTVLGSIDETEKRVAQRIKANIKKFKFNDAIAKKGSAARIHWGVIAQDVQSAFAAEGLDAEKYGLFCADSWFEKDGKKVLDDVGEIMRDGECPEGAVKVTRLGVRYEELLAFVIASM